LQFARARDLSSDSAHLLVLVLLVAVGTFFLVRLSAFAVFFFCSRENLWSFQKCFLMCFAKK
jgi:hypothetical protein